MSRMMARGTPTKIQRRRWRRTLASLDRHPSYPVDVLIFSPPLLSHMPPSYSRSKRHAVRTFDGRLRKDIVSGNPYRSVCLAWVRLAGLPLSRAWHVRHTVGVKEEEM